MVARIARGADFRLDESAVLELARTPAPPALIENAILSATDIQGSASDVRKNSRKQPQSPRQAVRLRER